MDDSQKGKRQLVEEVRTLRTKLAEFEKIEVKRKREEEPLEANERQLAAIYANVPGILFYLAVEPAEHFRFASVNRAFLLRNEL